MSDLAKKKTKLNLDPIYTEISKLLLTKNPEQISFSMVSRITKVPRTTLYYYFNSKIENLIIESVRFSMKTLMQLWDPSPESSPTALTQDFKTWDELQMFKFEEAIKLTLESPWILRLYFRYCRDNNYIGKEIRFIKDSYLHSNNNLRSKFKEDTLNLKAQLYVSNIKLGILWGLLDNENVWREEPEALAEASTKLFSHITQSMNLK